MQVRAIFREPARLFQLTSVPENVNVTIGYLARDINLKDAMVATQRVVSVLPYIFARPCPLIPVNDGSQQRRTTLHEQKLLSVNYSSTVSELMSQAISALQLGSSTALAEYDLRWYVTSRQMVDDSGGAHPTFTPQVGCPTIRVQSAWGWRC